MEIIAILLDILPILLEAGTCLTVGSILGFAIAVEYALPGGDKFWEIGYSLPYWQLVKRTFWINQLFGWCLLAWIFEEGPTLIFLISASLGLILGVIAGLQNPRRISWPRRSIIFGLFFCALDFFVYAVDIQFLGLILGPLAIGLANSGLGAIMFFVFLGLLKLIHKGSINWPFNIALIGSLLLTSGGPFLWMVIATAVGFGYSGSSRYLIFPNGASTRSIICQGFLALVLAHTLFQLYFYEISRYGIFWSPNVAVAPYALGGLILGFFMHRVKIVSLINGKKGKDRKEYIDR